MRMSVDLSALAGSAGGCDRPTASQLPRLATGRAAVTNGHSHRMLC